MRRPWGGLSLVPDQATGRVIMKNIVLCFDGTWNTADAAYPTNVVKTAQMILPSDERGAQQVLFYDEGVGSARAVFAKSINNFLGGAFGIGLMDNIEQAYRFLAFNYAPGDRIFIFGFSRGAFSARSFCGLVRTCGVLRKGHIRRVREAIELYQKRDRKDGPDTKACIDFRQAYSFAAFYGERKRGAEDPHPLAVEYMGLWDTVGALGLPRHFVFAHAFNRKYQFHDVALSRMVKSARHALAIDERRSTFTPSRWDNLKQLNDAAGPSDAAGVLPYQQIWFPGDHASVGGGGDVNGLWQASLTWVVEGARLRGLAVDTKALEDYRKDIDLKASVYCMKRRTFSLSSISFRRARKGPDGDRLSEVSDVAVERVRAPGANLFEKRNYRPKTLRAVIKKHAGEWGLT